MLYGQNVFVLITYEQVVYMLYRKIVYIYYIDNGMSDDKEYVNN